MGINISKLDRPKIITHNDLRHKWVLLTISEWGSVVTSEYFDNEQEAVVKFNQKADFGIKGDILMLNKIVLLKKSETTPSTTIRSGRAVERQ